jgi:hypothetical protein
VAFSRAGPPSGEGRKGRQRPASPAASSGRRIVFHVGGGSADRALSCGLRFKGMFCLALVYVWGAALEIGGEIVPRRDVWFVRDCFVFFLRCIGFGFSILSGAPARRSRNSFEISERFFYVSRVG